MAGGRTANVATPHGAVQIVARGGGEGLGAKMLRRNKNMQTKNIMLFRQRHLD
jgi:hypothetical protein